MKTFTLAFALILSANALPATFRHEYLTLDDTTILNYALTLEHLETAFYSAALAKFDDAAFAAAGMPPWVRGRFLQISDHEHTHVAFLTNALGENATQPCNYSFPYTDPTSFVALSHTLEGVGVSAYAGAAHLVSNKDYLTPLAVVLSTESRHAGWVAAAVNTDSAWSGPFDTPLGLNEVYTLAAAFITSCPPTNPVLPFKSFPPLSITSTSSSPLKPNDIAHVNYTNSTLSSASAFVAFFSGLNQSFVPIVDGQVTIPDGLKGTVYAVVSTDGMTISDATTRAGPAILQFPFSSRSEDSGSEM